MELVTRYLKLLIYFAIGWFLLFVYSSNGCRKIEDAEMESAIKRDKIMRTKPTRGKIKAFKRSQDIVGYTFVRPGAKQHNYAGRIIGLPGDKVRIEKGAVYVNGEPIPEKYVGKNRSADDFEEIIVPRDCLFILCDNRRRFQEHDSRNMGPIHKWAVEGMLVEPFSFDLF